jgi:hypothetical protein
MIGVLFLMLFITMMLATFRHYSYALSVGSISFVISVFWLLKISDRKLEILL